MDKRNLEKVVNELVQIMYLTHDDATNQMVLDPDKEVDSETLSEITTMLEKHGLHPSKKLPWAPGSGV